MKEYIEYKRSVLKYTRWLSENGYFGALKGSGGNVSIRIEGENACAITPSGLSYTKMAPDDICVLDFEKNRIEGILEPSMESGMHIAIYEERPDVNAVVHTHQTRASMFSVINRPIPALFDEVCMNIGEIVDVVPYALSGSEELAENVAAKMGNGCNCYIMQNHGALSLGSTIEKACLNAELLEKIATIYADALFTGEKISTLPEETVKFFNEMRETLRKKSG
ncbi:MAG: class II aldolase/adducin family protein [Deltaproteobacteria bacterium]|nr:class II aldolase/adducin family protein [Deltaproteobacteria bacterium]MBN2844446.1 class II aldolase/adducin family protein [Deltaproteobacteria bacterium]